MKSSDFVEYIFRIISNDKGVRALLRRADNETYEWRSWPLIYPMMKDLDNDIKRRSYLLVAAAIAKSGLSHDGNISLGRAFRLLPDGSDREFSPRFMRVLSAEAPGELLDILRPALTFMAGNGISLNYSSVLDDLVSFSFPGRRQNVKTRWAMQFLSSDSSKEE